jgi:hypothetical protein
MFGRLHAAVFGLLAGLGLAAAGAATLPAPIAAVAAGLERAGYTDVRVTERIFGGFAIQGKKGADFAMVVLDADGKMLDHAELFRDVDGDGVFETNETLGMPGRTVLRGLIIAALDAPPGSAERKLNYGTVDGAGFEQNAQTLFAKGGLRVDAEQTLGSGGIASTEQILSLNYDAEGIQRRGESRVQQKTMSGLGSLTLSATAVEAGGVTGGFAPLTVDVPTNVTSGVDAEGIRRDVAANTPDAAALKESITANTPSAAALTQQIMSTAPTAESIRASITAPTPPSVP